jgi:Protein of unknown function (DUF3303)
MLFMIVERFKNGDPVPVYQRFRERGRLAPEGLYYESSWVDVTLETCYQVMETSDAALIDQWIANWADLVECAVVPVMTSKEAAAKLVGVERPRSPATPFGGATPIFRVQNLVASVEYYVNVLGFTVDWQDPGIIASVSRDRCGIFLTEGDRASPARGSGSASPILSRSSRTIAARAPGSGSRRRTSAGRTKCRSRIWMDTCSGSDPSRRKVKPSVRGSTCTAVLGGRRRRADGSA